MSGKFHFQVRTGWMVARVLYRVKPKNISDLRFHLTLKTVTVLVVLDQDTHAIRRQ